MVECDETATREGKGKSVMKTFVKGGSIDRVAIKIVCERAHAGFETEAVRCDAPEHDESRTQPPGGYSMQEMFDSSTTR